MSALFVDGKLRLIRNGICLTTSLMAVFLGSLSAQANGPWFSGYMNPTNSYRIYAFTDWDTPLFGPGILPDTDCLGVQPPNYTVDGHVVFEADGTGNCVVIEATGSYSVQPGFTIGSVYPVSVQSSSWFNGPSNVPTSDTRDDYSSQFLNIVADPVNSQAATNGAPVQASIALTGALTVAVSWPSQTNHNYQVEWAPQITPTNLWYFLGTSIAGNATTNTVYDSANSSSRFYRVITVQ